MLKFIQKKHTSRFIPVSSISLTADNLNQSFDEKLKIIKEQGLNSLLCTMPLYINPDDNIIYEWKSSFEKLIACLEKHNSKLYLKSVIPTSPDQKPPVNVTKDISYFLADKSDYIHAHLIKIIQRPNWIINEYGVPNPDVLQQVCSQFEKLHGYSLLEKVNSLTSDFSTSSMMTRIHFYKTICSIGASIVEQCLEYILEKENSIVYIGSGSGLYLPFKKQTIKNESIDYYNVLKGNSTISHCSDTNTAIKARSVPVICDFLTETSAPEKDCIYELDSNDIFCPSLNSLKQKLDNLVCTYSDINFIVNPCPDYYIFSSNLNDDKFYSYCKQFIEYGKNLGKAIGFGNSDTQIALLSPISSLSAEQTLSEKNPVAELIFEYFELYKEYLLKEHLSYKIISEDALASSFCIDQRLNIKGNWFEVVLLPPITAMSITAAEKIFDFVEDGGSVIATNLLPVIDTEKESNKQIQDLFSKIFLKDPLTLREKVIISSKYNQTLLANGLNGAFFLESPSPEAMVPLIRTMISKVAKPNVSVRHNGKQCIDIKFTHRFDDNEDFYFFTNQSQTPKQVQISLRCAKAPHLLNLENGTITALPNCTQKSNRTILLHRFESMSSLAIAFSDEPSFAVNPHLCNEGYEIKLADDWKFRIFNMNSYLLVDWNHIKNNNDNYYEKEIEIECDYNSLELKWYKLDSEKLENSQISINDDFKHNINLSKSGKISIGKYLRTGKNVIRLTIYDKNSDSKFLEDNLRIWLSGFFSLHKNKKLIPTIENVKANDWGEQGYPYFRGTASYSQEIDIPSDLNDEQITLRIDKADGMMDVYVNNIFTATRYWSPYICNITNMLIAGRNKIELRFTNGPADAVCSGRVKAGLLSKPVLILC
ncbi:MAG: hypothetical protein SNJ70_00885 [Armatimonadota bacterium]